MPMNRPGEASRSALLCGRKEKAADHPFRADAEAERFGNGGNDERKAGTD